MGSTIMVYGNKTLGEGDDGSIQCVEAAAIIKLPLESTWQFVKEDDFTIVSNTDDVISIIGEEGVTVVPLSNATITSKGSAVNIKYEGNNTYLMWGSL